MQATEPLQSTAGTQSRPGQHYDEHVAFSLAEQVLMVSLLVVGGALCGVIAVLIAR